MTEGTAAALFRTWFNEVWNERKRDRIDAHVAPNCRIHALAEGGEVVTGPDGFRPFYDQLCRAFPDIRFEVHEVVGGDDFAAGRWSARMTHQGEGMGVAATGQALTLSGMAMIRVEGGKMIESWNEWDRLKLASTIGLVKPSTG
jgi:predicted ester cyclase